MLAIIAGRGALPLTLARACAAEGRPFAIFGIVGAAAPEIAAFPHRWVALGAIGGLFAALRATGCESVVLAGPIDRPDFRRLRLDRTGLRLLPQLVAAARGGDDGLLALVVRLIEAEGFRVLGAEDVLADLLPGEGALGRHLPSARDRDDIAIGARVVRLLGALDVGQGAVVCDGLVLAVEAAEGTDAMLARCATLPEAIRGQPSRRRGVLVKLMKRGQERRVDLPTIGPGTVAHAAAAGLAGIAVEAGRTLLLERAALCAEADARGLFVCGIRHDD